MIDLHSHTTASDGEKTPEELIDLALSKKLSAIAITDHDTISGLKSAFEYSKDKNIPLWKIAADMGINDGNLSRKLRTLSAEQERDIYNRIDRLAAEVGE